MVHRVGIDVHANVMPSASMEPMEKACPIVIRKKNGRTEVLAFLHPLAGKQFVKGTIEAGESPIGAATRELWEESGLRIDRPMVPLGVGSVGKPCQTWHFYKHQSSGLPETWSHKTKDDFGHTFDFFWHPLDKTLGLDWDPIFQDAFAFFAPLCR